MGIAQLSVIAKRKGAGAPVALTLINSKAPKAERNDDGRGAGPHIRHQPQPLRRTPDGALKARRRRTVLVQATGQFQQERDARVEGCERERGEDGGRVHRGAVRMAQAASGLEWDMCGAAGMVVVELIWMAMSGGCVQRLSGGFANAGSCARTCCAVAMLNACYQGVLLCAVTRVLACGGLPSSCRRPGQFLLLAQEKVTTEMVAMPKRRAPRLALAGCAILGTLLDELEAQQWMKCTGRSVASAASSIDRVGVMPTPPLINTSGLSAGVR